jgi:hypothetical protein
MINVPDGMAICKKMLVGVTSYDLLSKWKRYCNYLVEPVLNGFGMIFVGSQRPRIISTASEEVELVLIQDA